MSTLARNASSSSAAVSGPSVRFGMSKTGSLSTCAPLVPADVVSTRCPAPLSSESGTSLSGLEGKRETLHRERHGHIFVIVHDVHVFVHVIKPIHSHATKNIGLYLTCAPLYMIFCHEAFSQFFYLLHEKIDTRGVLRIRKQRASKVDCHSRQFGRICTTLAARQCL